MKKAFVKALIRHMDENYRIILLTGDLGYGVLTPLIEKYPERVINVGICEQNMTSVAAGLAMEGYIVFTYSIANFNTLRCYEQIRNDVAYHNADVKIISVGGGFSYGSLGVTHHATEDIAAMRVIPEMEVFSPADSYEAEKCLKILINNGKPSYMRLGRGGEPNIEHHDSDVSKPVKVFCCSGAKDRNNAALLSYGSIVHECIKAGTHLADKMNISVYSIPCIKPFNTDAVRDILDTNDIIITVEEHQVIGGIGSATAEVMAEGGFRCRLIRCGMDDMFSDKVGSTGYLRHMYGLDAEGIVGRVLNNISNG